MTDENLPIRSIGNPDPAATSDHIDTGDQAPKELDTLGDLNATNETSSSKVPNSAVSNTNREILLGRFRVQKVLGEGAFGKVYLAKDEQLNRLVAIKISKEIILDKNILDSFLSEAQMLAKLDHPNIVPVHDVGNSATEGFFIISKYLDGGTLSKALTTNASDITWVCKTIAMIADGLHHAHTRGLVHRDIKPDNILLDASGSPCIVDFGLALKEESFGQGKGLMGTPLYMSPEQAGGEGHRVDGRSDIFSLGVILYEMLAGRRPFEAKNVMMLLQIIKMVEVKPLRQINSKIDKELERICLKALSRKLLDRYATAADMADDLRSFLASGFMPSVNLQSAPSINIEGNKSGSKSGNISGLDSKNIQVVYKGLRSFDQSDAGFFLELLPGSRDREGLPPSIRFWKTQIENPSTSFSVGVIYGPSGCGKSSLMKAGLIPNLDGKIIPIYLEATTITTEESILKQLRKRLPDLPQELTLVEAFALIRKKKPAGLNRKLLLIVDQFEQWLSANPNVDNAPLVQALRQVDGDYFQVILMIRDDFILAMNRLMAVLEIPILEGVNFSLVDLFDQKHSRKVLRLFGRALECLPEGELSKEQQQFIHKSIEALSVDGKVISVRLAVFADMMKSRPWLNSSLNSIGGVEGVGVQFLEETFFSSGASALCKIHHKAAQKVLRALLPSSGSSIKGGMLSLEELKDVSTYANNPRDFEQLLQLLDSDLRLITPTTQEDDSDSKRFYQLAHDYLVPSLQEWLLRKQKETRKGRAELVLEDRSKVWNLNPEKRQLPSLIQCLSIRWNIPSKDWTEPQRKMIKKASKYYLVRSILVTSMLLMLGFLGWEGYLQRDRANKNEELAQVGLDEIKKAEEYDLKVIQIADKLELVLIPAGKFKMGSPESEMGHSKATTQHEVTLTKPFYMGKYEVTQEQWEAVMGNNQSRAQGAKLPVTDVSWNDCQEFIKKLNAKTKGGYRLPTEAEWEYACRAGTTTAHSFGDVLTNSDANIDGRSTKAVGSYRPNAFGVYDMHGNVWEWCEDWFDDYPVGAVTDPKGPGTGQHRVLRGASFDDYGLNVRRPSKREQPIMYRSSSFRQSVAGTNRSDCVGFRLARTINIEGLSESDNEFLLKLMREQKAKTKKDEETKLKKEADEANAKKAQKKAAMSLQKEVEEKADLGKSINLEMVLIPGGKFMMGSPASEHGRDSSETQHEVTLTQPFYMGKHEVTWEQWEAVTGDSYSKNAKSAVVDVSWEYCQEFIEMLNAKTAGGYRLPTEAEWEYACRAGTTTAYSFGDKITPQDANYGDSRIDKPVEVGSCKPNAFGLYHMHGNVWEWCEDWAGDYPAGAVTDPKGPATGTKRILRGGSSDYGESFARSSYRFSSSPTDRFGRGGFRLARTTDNAKLKEEEEAKAKQRELVKSGIEKEMVLIPAGKFKMGSPATEKGRSNNETPHEVTLTKPFYIGKYEVTQEQWKALMGNSPSEFKGPKLPVTSISWEECQEFIKRLNAKTSGGYRLPTEAEWEFSCRAGTSTMYSFGEEITPKDANYLGLKIGKPVAVGSYKPNAFGLYDMHGNVWEWCEDWHGEYPFAVTDPKGPAEGENRVLRGGSFYNLVSTARSSNRGLDSPTGRFCNNGFRLARTP